MRRGIVILPEKRWALARERWRRAEELGFHHAWTYDHLMWRWLRDEPWFGYLPTLTAAAAVTSRIRLGTLVATPAYRHPAPFAKAIVEATTHFNDPSIVAKVSRGLGDAMRGEDSHAVDIKLADRGW